MGKTTLARHLAASWDGPSVLFDLEDPDHLARLADPALYQSSPQEAQRLAVRLEEIDAELLVLLERWEALES